MKVYLAARFEHRETLRPVRDSLWKMGHEVVSSWIDETMKPAEMSQSTFWKKLAIKDLAEIQSADLFVLNTNVGSERGGKEVEAGFALGQFQSKLFYLVGPVRNVFHTLADRVFPTWAEFLDFVRTYHREETHVAYAAGLIDGEGCFQINRWQGKTAFRYRPTLKVAMTVQPPLKRLQALFGGSLSPGKQRPNPKHKPAHVWQLANHVQLAVATKLLLPYLTLKGPQAHIILAVIPLMGQGRGRRVIDKPQLECLYQEMKLLNRRGNF